MTESSPTEPRIARPVPDKLDASASHRFAASSVAGQGQPRDDSGTVLRFRRRPLPPSSPCEFCGVRMGLHDTPGACREAELRERALDYL